MTKNNIALIAAVAAGTAVVTVNHIKTVKVERAKRREIASKLERDIAAIKRSSEIVQMKIARGDYPFRPGIIGQIENDISFFALADHLQD